MKRRDAGCAMLAMLIAMAGAGCAARPGAEPLPADVAHVRVVPAENCTDGPIAEPVIISDRNARMQMVGGPYTISSSNDAVHVRANPSGNDPRVFDISLAPGDLHAVYSLITLTDTTDLATLHFPVFFFSGNPSPRFRSGNDKSATQICSDKPVALPALLTSDGSAFKLIGGPYRVSSDSPTIRAAVSGNDLVIAVAAHRPQNGNADITIFDDATGKDLTFSVSYPGL